MFWANVGSSVVFGSNVMFFVLIWHNSGFRFGIWEFWDFLILDFGILDFGIFLVGM